MNRSARFLSGGSVAPGSRESETHKIRGLVSADPSSRIEGFVSLGRSPSGEHAGVGEGSPFLFGEPPGPPERADDFMGQGLLRMGGIDAAEHDVADLAVPGGHPGDEGAAAIRILPGLGGAEDVAAWHDLREGRHAGELPCRPSPQRRLRPVERRLVGPHMVVELGQRRAHPLGAEREPLRRLRRLRVAHPRPRRAGVREAEPDQGLAHPVGIGRAAADQSGSNGPEDLLNTSRRLGQAGVSGVTFW